MSRERYMEKETQLGTVVLLNTSPGPKGPFLRFGSLFGPYFIKVGITVSQGSNPLNTL